MGVFADSSGHEQVVFCHDPATGLRAIIALHSTALGPGLGGTRFFPYADEEEALADVLRLSRAMTYKNACAGLDHGGGKAVIIGDPARDKSEALLRAYGRFVQSLGGRYYTACDVGTYVADMDVVARESDFVTGRSPAEGGAGDSAILTAYGVYHGMRAAAQHLWGSPSLADRRVSIAGVGKVGHHLVGHLLGEGAQVVVADVSDAAVARVQESYPGVVAVDVDALLDQEVDIHSPCALHGALDDHTVPRLTARIVCGAANNQLAHDGVESALAAHGVLYAPDFVVNAGGVVQVGDEVRGYSEPRARASTERIFTTTLSVLDTAKAEGISPNSAAERLAEARIAGLGRLRSIHLGPA